MTENASRATGKPAGSSGPTDGRPDGGRQRQQDTGTIGWVKGVLGLLAGISGLVYAIGYLAGEAHWRMLGLASVDCPKEEIIRSGGMFFITSVCCAAGGLFKSWLAVGALSMVVVTMVLATIRFCRRRGLGHSRARSRDDRPGLWMALRRWCRRMCFCSLRRKGEWIVRRVELLVPLACILPIGLSSIILNQGDLLVPAAEGPDMAVRKASEMFRAVTSFPGDLTELFREGTTKEPFELYGLYCLLLLACLVYGQRRIRRHIRGKKPGAAWRQASPWGRAWFAVTAFMLLVQVLLVFMLYGYLVQGNTYPVIRPSRFDAAEAACVVGGRGGPASDPTTKASGGQDLAAQPGNELVVFGKSGDNLIVYWLAEKKVIWVAGSDVLPAVRLPRKDVLKHFYGRDE